MKINQAILRPVQHFTFWSSTLMLIGLQKEKYNDNYEKSGPSNFAKWFLEKKLKY